MTSAKVGGTQEHILAAAAKMFARVGYSGVSTREIARLAAVNEITIYRYFPTKHELFMAALEREFQRLRVRPELVAQLTTAHDLRSVLRGLVELIHDALAQQPDLTRLLQFSALEFGGELSPLYKKYLGSMLDLAIRCLQFRVDAGELHCMDPRILILSLTAAIMMTPTLYPAIWGDRWPLTSSEGAAEFHADLWRTLLTANAEKA